MSPRSVPESPLSQTTSRHTWYKILDFGWASSHSVVIMGSTLGRKMRFDQLDIFSK